MQALLRMKAERKTVCLLTWSPGGVLGGVADLQQTKDREREREREDTAMHLQAIEPC